MLAIRQHFRTLISGVRADLKPPGASLRSGVIVSVSAIYGINAYLTPPIHPARGVQLSLFKKG
jgi:hypothetical protein